ncbi:hypothetical protein BDA99DRAFT_534601 [Phascolomyces articulosus]|uniref:F-box domain-containing protein n=1 Tax=Phascolomyces articulosus TaxID=60185 RepID=A0AAD5K5I7_9FUNG|nr:hypothetical protein BDA99DRAFT_534601 [Phascolomyces articulosus]
MMLEGQKPESKMECSTDNKSTDLHSAIELLLNELSATTVIEDCQDDLLEVAVKIASASHSYKKVIDLLESCANTWAKKGRTNKELKVALYMTKYAPKHPTGYYRAGSLLSLQGYQNQAIKIINQSLTSVSSDNHDYALLQQKRDYLTARLQRYIDFITACPYDIVTIIINKLSEDDIYECTRVTRSWRQQFLQLYAKKSIRVDQHPFARQITNPASYRLLPLMYQYIQELILYADPELIQKCLALFQHHGSCSLQSLEIRVSMTFMVYRNKERPLDICKDIENILTCVGSTLTNLELVGIETAIPPLVLILSTCRNLNYIRIAISTIESSWFSGLLDSEDETSLKRIELSGYRNMDMPAKALDKLLCRSPALNHLDLNGYKCNNDILESIEKHCTNLSKLILNRHRLDTIPDYNDKKSFIGIGTLEVLIIAGSIYPSALKRLLEKHGSSLKNFILAPDDHEGDNITTTSIQEWNIPLLPENVFLSSLQKFHVDAGKSAVAYRIIEELLCHCPDLMELELYSFKNGLSDKSINAIERMHRLEAIVINNVPILNTPSTSRLPRILQYLPSLTRVYINGCSGLTDDVLKEIAQIQTLEILYIYGRSYTDETSESGLYEFTQQLAILAKLTNVTINNILYLTDTSVRNLAASDSLKEVTCPHIWISQETAALFHRKGIYRN